MISAARPFITILYDPSEKESSHINLNSLRVKFATKKDKSLAKLPPWEAGFGEQAGRSHWQTMIWMSSHIAKPDSGSPEQHGCDKQNNTLVPVYFKGPMASKPLEGLICSCPSRSRCSINCVCSKGSWPCTELCTCHGQEHCGNPHSLDRDQDEDDEDGE